MPNHSGGHIHIQVSAPEHSGKTSLMVLLYNHLSELGAKVTLQRADPQIDDKLAAPGETLRERLKTVDILITEMQTHR